MLPEYYSNNRTPEIIRSAEPKWLLPEHGKQLLVFVHVPKAAGTSLHNVLWQIYGRRYLNYHEVLSGFRAESMAPEYAKDILAVGGHFPFGFHKSIGRDFDFPYEDGVFQGRTIRYITIVRDPADRLYSYYRFVISFPAHRLHQQTKGLTCKEFFALMETTGNLECENLQCVLVSGRGQSAEKAIAAIEDQYFAAVTIEDIESLVSFLERSLNWPSGRAQLETKNQSPKKDAPEDLMIVREFADRKCREDQKLYKYVRDNVSPRFRLRRDDAGSSMARI